MLSSLSPKIVYENSRRIINLSHNNHKEKFVRGLRINGKNSLCFQFLRMQCRYEGIRFVDDDVEFSHKTTWNVCVEKFSTVYLCRSTMLSIASGTKRCGLAF